MGDSTGVCPVELMFNESRSDLFCKKFLKKIGDQLRRMKLVGQGVTGLLKDDIEGWQKKETPETRPT